MRDYRAYNLPRPGPGQFYARSGNEVYLVTERTRQITDAFVLRIEVNAGPSEDDLQDLLRARPDSPALTLAPIESQP